MSDPTEYQLDGGNLGRVVRIAETVRRPAGPWTPAVHELLHYLDEAGFPYSPRPLGLDPAGREVLTYIEGETVGAAHPWPGWAWSDTALVQAGRLLRRYHETVAGFRPAGTRVWRFGTGHLDPNQVICHNDLAPYNVVWKRGDIVGIIDWDLASPGDPMSDLAFTAWSFAPIHHSSHAAELGAPTDVVRRVSLLCDSYGLTGRDGVLDAIRERMRAAVEGIRARAAEGEMAFQKLVADGHLARMEIDLRWLDLHYRQWQEELAAS